MAERTLTVKILGDSRSLQREFQKSSKAAAAYNTQLDKLSRGALAGSGAFGGFGRSIAFASTSFLGGAGFVAGAKAAVDAASNLNEQTSKGRAIFKTSAREIEQWAKTTAGDFGIAEDAALEATGTFGGLFNTVGVLPKRSAELSQTLVELAADLASFTNAVPTDALDALRSGLSGESEPLRRFQIFLSEARVQQEAFTQTGKRSAKELTNQDKVLARLAIIMRDSSAAQGDFARTQEGFANQTRILNAKLRDLSASLGKVALPALTDFVEELNRGIGIAEDFGAALEKIPLPPGTAERFGSGFKAAFKQGFLPGIVLAGQLADKVDFVKDRVAALRGEVAAPFDFNSLNALGVKFQLAGLAAKDLIEAQRELDRIRPARGPNITATQRNQFFDARIARQRDRAQDLDLRAQVARLEEISRQISARIAVTKDITRKLTLEDELLSVRRERKSILEQIASNARADAEAAKQAAADARSAMRDAGQALIDALQFGLTKAQVTASFADDLAALNAINAGLRARIRAEGETLDLQQQLFANQREILEVQRAQRNARQFRALGLSATGGERVPGLTGLRRQLGNFETAVQGTFLDTKKTQSVLTRMRKVLSGGLGAVSEDVRATVRDMLRDLNQQLKDFKSSGPQTLAKALDVSDVLKGLTGTAAQLARARNILTGATVVPRPIGAGAGGVTVIINGDIRPENFDAFMREIDKHTKRTSVGRR